MSNPQHISLPKLFNTFRQNKVLDIHIHNVGY